MSRCGLIAALIFAAVIGLLFGIFPDLDLKIAALFYDPATGKFPLRTNSLLGFFRDAMSWLLVIVAAPAALSLLVPLATSRLKPWMSARAAIFLLATLLLAPGLLVNVVLKGHWSRPRPVAVVEFGGVERFVPWWDPRGQCRHNCSFVAGEASSGFWMLAPASLAPPSWRLLAYVAATALGIGMGIVRMAMGAHFFSDVAFAGIFTFIIIWLAHRLIFRAKPES